MADNDDFGGDDFLADFDVDAAVAARNEHKRLKLSPQSTNAPKIAVGHKVDPQKELVAPNQVPPSVLSSLQNTLTGGQGPPRAAVPINNNNNKTLEDTLQHFFGFSKFRPGQRQVLEALLTHKDSAVFWSTGSGKSICYMIPPLHLNQVALVVSPLISLMQDQVSKLNGLFDGAPLATFLGSGQMDINEEHKALNGDYRLVYVTPEKVLSTGFISRLQDMHRSKARLCLMAIDESHCVSEYGHDFRPQYRQLHQLRQHLTNVPMIALTATAIPRVQQDIVQCLQLRDPYVARQSFDRTNLQINVLKKPPGGYRGALGTLLSKMQAPRSTIVYAPTRDAVQEIALYLQQVLPDTTVVQSYHAGLSQPQRAEAHTNFLVGTTHVMVATVAFGMGIDKPDIRQIIHIGPPKTVEEYYQQIGRAGRDGLPADCFMFVGDSDFDRYKSDFYAGSLGAEAKRAMFRSIEALRQYALDTETCRRKALLEFFEEVPQFGERCGTCDTCRRVAKYGIDLERDLANVGARIVLQAMDAVHEQGLSTIEKVIGGTIVEGYRYRHGCDPSRVQQTIQQARKEMGSRRKYPISHFRELVAPLVSKGYVQRGSKQMKVDGYSRSWTTYSLTPRGQEVLQNPSAPIVLTVPQSMRDAEQKEEERRQRILKQLDEAGVDVAQIPKEEVESGEGEVIRAFTKWHGYLAQLQKSGRNDRHAQLEDLLCRIQSWRSSAAASYRMAPASVLAEHTMVFVAYTVAAMKPAFKVERSALVGAGVRTRELDALVDILNHWMEEVQPASSESGLSAFANDRPMVFGSDAMPLVPAKPWKYAVYKPVKKTGIASWESSHNRFIAGEHPQAIAMSPENGRPIQVGTVVGHILEALVQGRPVPLDRLAQVASPPTKFEWEKLEEAERISQMDVSGDPNASEVKFTKTEFLRPIMGDHFVDTPYTERTDEDKATFGRWCDLLNWYQALKRVGFEPTFG